MLSESRGRASQRLIETRSAAECLEVVAVNRGSFVVVELEPARAEPALDLLFGLDIRFADTATAVVASRTLLSHEWLARELGAQAFVVSLLDLECLYELARRHAGRTSAGRGAVESRDLREYIWNNLPWGGA